MSHLTIHMHRNALIGFVLFLFSSHLLSFIRICVCELKSLVKYAFAIWNGIGFTKKHKEKRNVSIHLMGFCWNSQCRNLLSVFVPSKLLYAYTYTVEILQSWGRIEHCASLQTIRLHEVTVCDSKNTILQDRGRSVKIFTKGVPSRRRHVYTTPVSSIDFNRLSNNFKWLYRYIDFEMLQCLVYRFCIHFLSPLLLFCF